MSTTFQEVFSYSFKTKQLYDTIIIYSCLNILGKGSSYHAATATVEQFPIRIFYASTAHKMQGQTIKAGCTVVIHWTKKMQGEEGMGYVMLGRSERLEDIFIVADQDIGHIKCSTIALKESDQMYETYLNNTSNALSISQAFWKIAYLNVRSLRAHIRDVSADERLMSCDIVSFGETWLQPGEKLEIESFEGHFASSGFGKGTASYTKQTLSKDPIILISSSFSVVVCNMIGINIISVYLSKNVDQKDFCAKLSGLLKSDQPSVVFGDFNIEFSSKSYFKTFMLQNDFSEMLENPTHDSGSHIDHLYVSSELKKLKIFSEQLRS